MSRVIVPRNLPPLNKALKHFSRFPAGKSHRTIMIDELREVAKSLRKETAHPFYSMREVAGFFKAPLSTIFPVYKALENEGVINRIRSSRTMLTGKVTLRREPVRGVVGIPIAMDSMVLLPYTQTFVMELEERLGRLRYIADIVFTSSAHEKNLPDWVTRLLRRSLDAVILHSPRPRSKQDILSLRERGVRVLVVQRKDSQIDLPGLIYLQDYAPAYGKMATRWRELGIRRVVCCTPPENLHYTSEIENLRRIANQYGLEFEAVADEPRALLKRIREYKPKAATAIAFLDFIHAELFCNREPAVIEEIEQMARLAFCVGPVRIPYLQFRKLRVDIVDFSPTEMAARLTDDIARLSVLPDGLCHTFVAQYREQELL